MKKIITKLDVVRERGNEVQNHVVDEFLGGRLSRRELLRAGSVLGLWTLTGGNVSLARATAVDNPVGTTLRIGHPTPSSAIDPVTAFDVASPALLNQAGEYLVNVDGGTGVLNPCLATSWSVNSKGDIWTFKIRTGVRFNNGQPLTARDVVATFARLTSPSVGSAALSLFKGTLSANGVRAVDDHTVEFHLDGPNGAFPYYVSSDNVNGVVLPFDYAGPYEKSFIGTGPYKLSEFLPQVGASFVRNPGYWGQAPSIQRVEFKFYEDQQRQLIAIQGREVDLLTRFTVHGGLGVMNNPQFKIQGTRSSTHRQLHMRTSDGEFKDKRVRRALAMSLDRDAIVRGLLREKAVIGNDHPFAPFFSTFDSTVPQRGRDINGAKALLAQAGVPNGFSATLTTEAFLEMPDLAVVIQNAARSIGINLALRVEPQAAYYGAGTLGKSDWLDSPLGMTDYAHRGVPDAFLKGPLMANGPWNAARFANPRYDELVKVYLSTLDVSAKKQTAGQIERLLIDETPVIIPYFSDSLTLTRANVSGVRFTPMAQLYVDRAIVS